MRSCKCYCLFVIAIMPVVLIAQSVLTGTIAYVRRGTEIRTINPSGSADKQLWTDRDATEDLGIYQLAWSPDGKELAFSSAHEAAYSFYHSDIYGIKPDGSGFRKITNSPDRSELTHYPKGSVSVTVSNDQPIYQTSNASSGVFLIYVTGADEPQQVVLPPGAKKNLLFKSVADFGSNEQAVVAMYGKYRWFIPGVFVEAGRTIKAPAFSITGDGIDLFGAFRPVWRSDGSRISYRSGFCTINSVPVHPSPGKYVFNPIFGGENPLGTCTWDWGPTPELADQIIYTENASSTSDIYQIREGKKHPGVKLLTFSDIQYQLLLDLHWLPDGSGLLFSNATLMRDAANIYKYDFASKQVIQLTHLENEFVRTFSISPDGNWLVFERSRSLDDDKDCDLWVIKLDGKEARLLVKNGQNPAWGK